MVILVYYRSDRRANYPEVNDIIIPEITLIAIPERIQSEIERG